ncbi:hypothetical protein Noda2021_07370 [Candidatus Dependentiae bacterium Noda2021]|nr:hypothetical protein Noda2021_07370 [Candidatus Dependentiae bacterium Noda2021]
MKNKIIRLLIVLFTPVLNAQVVYVYAPGWEIPVYFDATGTTKHLSSEGITIQQVQRVCQIPDNAPALFFDIDCASAQEYASRAHAPSALFLWEPPSVKPYNYDTSYHQYFNRIYTWNDALIDNMRYYKFYYPVRHNMKRSSDSFNDKKLCVMVTAYKSSHHPNQLYTERSGVVHFFEKKHPQDFDLYGYDWPSSIRVYKGTIDDKLEKVSHYKFSIAYENIKDEPGYVTEKMFHCFAAGTVPIYWGASNIYDYVPHSCFIDRTNFSSNEELYDYLTNMSEETHQTYLSNIEQYLQTPAAHNFSNAYFAQLITRVCTELLK